jgi:hypothetical protein
LKPFLLTVPILILQCYGIVEKNVFCFFRTDVMLRDVAQIVLVPFKVI